MLAELAVVLGSLNDRLREQAIVALYLADVPAEEIAERFGIAESAVYDVLDEAIRREAGQPPIVDPRGM